jgi:transcription initiation factor IIE alpha subunit
MGDIMYNLSAENIIKANEIELEDVDWKENIIGLDKNLDEDEIDNYFHCDRCGADLNEACSCGEE